MRLRGMRGVVFGWSVCLLAALAARADWPTYMADYARGGVTAEAVAPPFTAAWTYRAPAAPRTAWAPPQEGFNELPRITFDDALYAVSVGDTVYFGSSVDHKVYALDAATGQVRWAFFTGGPVRLAPTIHQQRVYFGSDDGYAYCLNAVDGRVIWKVRGGPGDQRMLGSGRLISRWPVRTGVIVDGGVAYFGAGVFPHHGTFLVAVNAADGAERWRVNGFQGDRAKGNHWFTPQGYLLASPTHLFAPSGRSVAACFAREDGANVHVLGKLHLPQAAINLPKGAAGGSYGLLAEGMIVAGMQNNLYSFTQDTTEQKVSWVGARRLLITPDTAYVLTGASPAPRNNDAPGITAVNRAALPQAGKFDASTLEAHTRWRLAKRELASMILAGSVLYAGGQNEVLAFDAATGKELWKAPVEGKAVGLAAAGGRLFVSTDRGAIHCFAKDAAAVPVATATAALPADARLAATAQAVLAEARTTKGCCLVIGGDSARLAHEIAQRSEMQVFAFEPNPAKLDEARRMLDAAGLYGTRVVVDSGTPDALPYPQYFANLVVVTDPAPSMPADELLRVLRPYGGILLREGVAGQTPAAWQDAGEVRRNHALAGREWTRLVRGALPGAGGWTHQYADPGNTTSSEDQRVVGPLDVLWYGEPGPTEAPERHLRSVAPLVVNGRVFYQGFRFRDKRHYVACFDAYNGTKYWERDLPGAYRVYVTNNSSNLACTAEALFVVVKSSCHRLDPLTGEIVATYETPADADGTKREWAYLAAVGDLLFGSVAKEARFSDALFAIDVKTGAQRWLHRGGTIRNNTIAISDGRVLFAELREGVQTVDDEEAARIARLGLEGETPANPYVRTVVALDMVSGTRAWERNVDLTGCGPWASQLFGLAKHGVYVLCGGYSRYGGLKGGEANRRAAALAIADGKVVWNEAIGNLSRPLIMGDMLISDPTAFDLRTGKRKTQTDPRTKREVPWKMGFFGAGCGPMTASANILFFRYGFTGWYDVANRSRTSFAGVRPGCWMNIIPASGVVVQTEASSGCICYHTLQCTMVLAPRGAQ